MYNVVFASLSIAIGVVVAALLILAIIRDERRPMSALEALLDGNIDWDAELADLVRSQGQG
jgi:hypothetical protein